VKYKYEISSFSINIIRRTARTRKLIYIFNATEGIEDKLIWRECGDFPYAVYIMLKAALNNEKY
jgi:hypothetical protein